MKGKVPNVEKRKLTGRGKKPLSLDQPQKLQMTGSPCLFLISRFLFDLCSMRSRSAGQGERSRLVSSDLPYFFLAISLVTGGSWCE